MAFTFKPGPPKEATHATYSELVRAIKAGSKPTGAKSVGGGSMKVFMSGPMNYYMTETPQLHTLLETHGIG